MTAQALPRSTPESQGIPSTAILALIEGLKEKQLDMHSLMVMRRGQVIWESWWHPCASDRKHMLFSLSKSFTSTAAGFAVQEGRLTLNDFVVEIFPDKLPTRVPNKLQEMRIRDLLTMSTGHEDEPPVWEHRDWVEAFLAHPVKHEPGTHFLYNTPATYMVSAILNRLTGEDLVDYLKPRLFDPLGIDGETWERCPMGIRTGGFGLSLRTEEIAKFGVFYAQRGKWEGKQLLSESWIDQATSKQVPNGDDPNNDWNQGYGFQFWQCRHGAYRGDGAFGQYCIVSPKHDLAIAITSGVSDMQAVLDQIWQHLLPSIGSEPLPEVDLARTALELRGPEKAEEPRPLPKASYRVADGKGTKIDGFEVEGSTANIQITIREAGQNHLITAAFGDWGAEGLTTFQSPMPTRYGEKGPTAYRAKAAWTRANELTLRIAYIETPFTPWLVLRFDGDKCLFQSKGAISLFDSMDRPELIGETS